MPPIPVFSYRIHLVLDPLMEAYHQWRITRKISLILRIRNFMSAAETSSFYGAWQLIVPRAYVDVIIPVHNASQTIVETVQSAMNQTIPQHLSLTCPDVLDVAVCCHDDGSTDESWHLLCKLKQGFGKGRMENNGEGKQIHTKLLVSTSEGGIARGAGYARNRAATLRSINGNNDITADSYFLCLLDSDDIMHETRVAEQVCAMLALDKQDRDKTIMGCTFDRDPPGSTWHYAQWANGLTDERLMLERYREVTVLQPTWFMTKSRFQSLGGYVEAPHPSQVGDDWSFTGNTLAPDGIFRVVHETYDTPHSLRLAEDLRLFHSHLISNGLLRLHRTERPLVTYRHRAGTSQSSKTPRKLLLQLRVLAFEKAVLCGDPLWSGRFVVWGAGRDGKDFVKALSEGARKRVACFVDVDERKIESGHYVNRELDIRIPIFHFSWLAQNYEEVDHEAVFGRIHKKRNMEDGGLVEEESSKKRKSHVDNDSMSLPKKRSRSKSPAGLDLTLLSKLPVVVCVAMYRTNGALEANVESVGRTEGKDLWHFS